MTSKTLPRSWALWVPVLGCLLLLAGTVAVDWRQTGRLPAIVPESVRSRTGDVGADDGYIGDARVGMEDTHLPAIAKLDPDLREAVRAAAADADIPFRVTSGWRSRAYQEQLLDQAIDKYGSRAEALRWVNTPDKSRHVTGEAIDIGPTDAAYWLSQHGADYGLCQVYGNEIWHYELLTTPGGRCPALRADGAS